MTAQGRTAEIQVSVGQMLLDLSPAARSSIGRDDDATPNDEAWCAIVALGDKWNLDPPKILLIARILLQISTLNRLVHEFGPETVDEAIRASSPTPEEVAELRRVMDELMRRAPYN